MPESSKQSALWVSGISFIHLIFIAGRPAKRLCLLCLLQLLHLLEQLVEHIAVGRVLHHPV